MQNVSLQTLTFPNNVLVERNLDKEEQDEENRLEGV